jgi:transposase
MAPLVTSDFVGLVIPMIVKQSGREPSYYGISKKGMRTFRNITYQVGRFLAVNNPDEMEQTYLALKERGKHPRQA